MSVAILPQQTQSIVILILVAAIRTQGVSGKIYLNERTLWSALDSITYSIALLRVIGGGAQ